MKKILGHIRKRLIYIAAGAGIGMAGALPEFLKPFAQPAETHALRAEFAKTALGRDLLDYAQREKITIAYNMTRDTLRVGEYHHWNNRALVDSTLSMTDQVVCLAHELWHARQDETLRYGHFEQNTMMSPGQRWTLRQFLESDAAAFSTYFWADRMVTLDQQWPYDSKMKHELEIALKLRREMERDGVTPDEYRTIALEPCLASRNHYREKHLDLASGQMSALCEAAEKRIGFNRAARKLRAAPDSAAFENLLRKMGGFCVAEDSPTALQDTATVSSRTLLTEYPFRTFDTSVPGTVPSYAPSGPKKKAPREIVAAQTAEYKILRARVLGRP